MSVMITTGAPTEAPPEVGTVAYEAARLDRLYPGWADRVDPNTLHMPSCELCILGQVYGDFENGYPIVKADRARLRESHLAGAGLYASHQQDWIDEIWRRR